MEFEYFVAGSDDAAAAVIDRVGGPGSQLVEIESSAKRGRRLISRKRSAKPEFGTDPDLVVFETLAGFKIEPTVQLGTLESLLTERSYDDVIEDPRQGDCLAVRDEGALMVLTTTVALTAALAAASDEELAAIAKPWSKTEEFWGEAKPRDLRDFLKKLARLARQAVAQEQQIYCWFTSDPADHSGRILDVTTAMSATSAIAAMSALQVFP